MVHDPQQIKNTASSFLLAADRCFEMRPLPNGQFQMPLAPAIVCAAFGIELYLKAIITVEKGKATGHELLKLFVRLSPQSKAALATELSLPEKELLQKLSYISGTFVEWRYIYETQTANIDTEFLRQFSKATARLLDSLTNLPPNTGTPSSSSERSPD